MKQAPRNLALIENLNEQAAEMKIVSVLFLSLGQVGKKSVTDKFLNMRVATVTSRELRTTCNEAFGKARNKTQENCKFFPRKRKEMETLRQFWHTRTGLAAKCKFGEQT